MKIDIIVLPKSSFEAAIRAASASFCANKIAAATLFLGT